MSIGGDSLLALEAMVKMREMHAQQSQSTARILFSAHHNYSHFQPRPQLIIAKQNSRLGAALGLQSRPKPLASAG